jgi:hypothetical protein
MDMALSLLVQPLRAPFIHTLGIDSTLLVFSGIVVAVAFIAYEGKAISDRTPEIWIPILAVALSALLTMQSINDSSKIYIALAVVIGTVIGVIPRFWIEAHRPRKFCLYCHHELDPWDRFCYRCGQSQVPEQKRQTESSPATEDKEHDSLPAEPC